MKAAAWRLEGHGHRCRHGGACDHERPSLLYHGPDPLIQQIIYDSSVDMTLDHAFIYNNNASAFIPNKIP